MIVTIQHCVRGSRNPCRRNVGILANLHDVLEELLEVLEMFELVMSTATRCC